MANPLEGIISTIVDMIGALYVIQLLQNSTELIACSDGSVDPMSRKAAFNWRVITPDEVATIEHSAPTFTNPKYMDSYRSEYDRIRDRVKYMKMRGHTKGLAKGGSMV